MCIDYGCPPPHCTLGFHGLLKLVFAHGVSCCALSGEHRRLAQPAFPLCDASWSVSFYPQVLLNFRRKTSVGLSFDFLLYNVLAFSCYSAFTCEWTHERYPSFPLFPLPFRRCPSEGVCLVPVLPLNPGLCR